MRENQHLLNPPERPSRYYVPLLCLGLVLLKGFGSDILVGAPINRLLELTICREYYNEHDPAQVAPDGTVDEKLCKLPAIQTELAVLLGTAGFFSPLAELLISVPLGILADKKGRKPALLLNMVAGLCYYGWVVLVCVNYSTFSSKYVLYCAVFYLFGGGPQMFSALVLALVADSTSSGARARVFYYVQCMVQVVQMLAPAAGSFFLALDIWIPFYVGLSAQLAQVVPIYLLPAAGPSDAYDSEGHRQPSAAAAAAATAATVHPGKARRPPHHRGSSYHGDEEPLLPTPSAGDSEAMGSRAGLENKPHSWKQRILIIPSQFSFFAQDRRISYSLAASFFASLSRGFVGIILQYTSVRYGWSFSQAGYLLSVKALVSVILFLAILPSATTYFTCRCHLSPQFTDLIVSRASVSVLSVGCAVIGLSPNIGTLVFGLVFVSFGLGFGAAMQSFVTSLVSESNTAKLYSTISVAETVGSLVSHPLLAWSLAAGIRAGGVTIGLPFFICAGIYGVAALPVWLIQVGGTAG